MRAKQRLTAGGAGKTALKACKTQTTAKDASAGYQQSRRVGSEKTQGGGIGTEARKQNCHGRQQVGGRKTGACDCRGSG